MNPGNDIDAMEDNGLMTIHHVAARGGLHAPCPARSIEPSIRRVGDPSCRPRRPERFRTYEYATQSPVLFPVFQKELGYYLPGPVPAGDLC